MENKTQTKTQQQLKLLCVTCGTEEETTMKNVCGVYSSLKMAHYSRKWKGMKIKLPSLNGSNMYMKGKKRDENTVVDSLPTNTMCNENRKEVMMLFIRDGREWNEVDQQDRLQNMVNNWDTIQSLKRQ